MSIIVVVKKAGKAVIAADSLYTFGSTKVHRSYLRRRDKIRRFEDSFVGLVGVSAHDNVFAHLVENHKSRISFDSVEAIYDTYLKLHPILKEEYFMNPSEGENDEPYESSQIDALIANPNGIFGMYSWREVYEFEKFWAIGSGTKYALGAIFAGYDALETPEQIAEAGIRAACEFDDGCDLPVVSFSVELSPRKE